MWLTLLTTIWLLTGSVMDIRKRRVSVWLLLAGGVFAVTVSFLQCIGGEREYVDILKGTFPGLAFLVIAFITQKAGYGDGIVLLCLGILSGGGKSLLLFGLSLFLISIFSLVLLILRKAGRNTRIPYLPFLTAAWLITAMLIDV